MKVRIIIEYDPDWPTLQEGETIESWLEQEREDWLQGNIVVSDIIDIGGAIKFEVIQ